LTSALFDDLPESCGPERNGGENVLKIAGQVRGAALGRIVFTTTIPPRVTAVRGTARSPAPARLASA
jgi:hypothetical protein